MKELIIVALIVIISMIALIPPPTGTGNLVHKWETWTSSLIVDGIATFNGGVLLQNLGIGILVNSSASVPTIAIRNADAGALSFTEFQLFNDAGQVSNIFTTTNALGAFLPRYNNSLFVSTTNGGNLILGNILSGDIIFTAGGINNRFEILGSGAVNSYVPTYIQSTLRADDYYSGDNSQGITNTTGFWFCTNSDCTATCQAQIKDGLITGCV